LLSPKLIFLASTEDFMGLVPPKGVEDSQHSFNCHCRLCFLKITTHWIDSRGNT